MPIVDFHSHILPGIDDGSKDMDMTKEMLQESASQKIDIMVATPHFYADYMSMDEFLRARKAALEKAKPYAERLGIRLVSGAEVQFFPNMSAAKDLEKLCIEGTNLILVEMPFRPWEQYDLSELERLIKCGYQPIIAHLERFLKFQTDKRKIDVLFELPVYIQINAEAFLRFRTRGYVLKLFRDGRAHLIGSDCHNLTGRRQNLGEARAVIEKRLGTAATRKIDLLSCGLLNGKKVPVR